ncbi:CIC11C00000001225 [Sungouiella intermedia]|uniref:CIC11C00000001225 n=1 Tax=Sungouiella intermedia TaxID=45354 RepID=A0A1L0DF20_9ASCO|nr:CIC11C00000001225 [[Candida] intermedia]
MRDILQQLIPPNNYYAEIGGGEVLVLSAFEFCLTDTLSKSINVHLLDDLRKATLRNVKGNTEPASEVIAALINTPTMALVDTPI